MDERVGWLVELRVRPGQLERFRALTQEMVQAAGAEAGVLAYQRFVDPAGTVALVSEWYADSSAALDHLHAFEARFADRYLGLVERLHFTVLGQPSAELKRVLDRLGASYLMPLDGFHRLSADG